MKIFLTRAAFVVLGFMLGIVFTFILLRSYFPSHSVVEVTLKNNASKNVDAVRLTHEHGMELVENLQQGDNAIIRFYAAGETSYKLQVTFSDGKKIEGGAGYAETGYKITETISDDKIESQYFLGYL